jgi:hypothetical protein
LSSTRLFSTSSSPELGEGSCSTLSHSTEGFVAGCFRTLKPPVELDENDTGFMKTKEIKLWSGAT